MNPLSLHTAMRSISDGARHFAAVDVEKHLLIIGHCLSTPGNRICASYIDAGAVHTYHTARMMIKCIIYFAAPPTRASDVDFVNNNALNTAFRED